MTTLFPNNGGFTGAATRFMDPAFGFALGWVRSGVLLQLFERLSLIRSTSLELLLVLGYVSLPTVSQVYSAVDLTLSLCSLSQQYDPCRVDCWRHHHLVLGSKYLFGGLHHPPLGDHDCCQPRWCPLVWRDRVLEFSAQDYRHRRLHYVRSSALDYSLCPSPSPKD